jgi:hypothetical protein
MAFFKKNEDYLKLKLAGNNIVLIHGCFHNGPVICPRLVIMALGRLYWPEAMPRAIMT